MTAVVFIGHSDCHGLSKEVLKNAIPARNRYMVKNADAAVCYIDHTWGNAAKTYAFAQRHGLWIQNIAQALT